MFKFITKIFVFVSLLLVFISAFQPVNAGRVDNLYAVEILVVDEYVTTRERAFSQGLDEIFIRISGDSTVMGKLKRPPSSRYVKQFSYAPIDPPIVNDDDELLTHRLKIRYNGNAMEKYLLDNELPAWGEYRPDVVVWLVIRDGRNEYVLKDVDQSVLKTSVAEAMARRGVPDQWPVYDQVDRKTLRVSDIRGGFKEPLIQASQRYSKGPVLSGSMIWNGKQWQSNWSLLTEGKSQHWNLTDVDHTNLIDRSIDQAGDALGVIFAVHTADSNQQLASVMLDLQAVNTIDDYSYVEKYLLGLSAVEKVKPAKVAGQNTVFEVLLRSNEEDFLNLIKNDAELTELDALEVQALAKGNQKTGHHEIENEKLSGSEYSGSESAGTKQTSDTGAGELKTPYVSLLADTEKNAADENLKVDPKTEVVRVNDPSAEVAQVKDEATTSPNVYQADVKQTYYYRLNRSQ